MEFGWWIGLKREDDKIVEHASFAIKFKNSPPI
jgi:hypothetical protein